MDNITHSLIGLATAELATQTRARHNPKAAGRLRLTALLVAAASNNVPDLDFLLSSLTGGQIGYLLQHRGYTHTLLLAPLQGLLIAGLAWLWAWRKKPTWTKADRNWLLGLALLGPLLHIGFDSLNSYGVHPFWPFNSHWFFGDTIFIIEPVIWITLLPLLIFESVSKPAKVIFSSLLTLIVGACVFTGYVPWQLTLILVATTAWLLGLMWKLKSGARAVVSTAACLFLVLGFAATSSHVRTAATTMVLHEFPGTQVLDIALTPMPANPLCWSLWTVETMHGWYFARHGTYAPAAAFFGAADCPEFRMASAHTFPLVPVPGPLRPELLWLEQFQAPISELQKLDKQSCLVAGLLKFARVPAWVKAKDGTTIVGDLRFDRGGTKGLATVIVPATIDQELCPKHVPDWIEPRRDLFVGD